MSNGDLFCANNFYNTAELTEAFQQVEPKNEHFQRLSFLVKPIRIFIDSEICLFCGLTLMMRLMS